jgi:hypothetical protein
MSVLNEKDLWRAPRFELAPSTARPAGGRFP